MCVSILEIKNLQKTYAGGHRAVDGLSLSIEPGQIYGFIGHNGAGKTTTLKAVTGLIDFEGGEILIDGFNVKTDAIRAKRAVAYVPDNPEIYDYLTGIQFLNFMADMYEMSAAGRKDEITRISDAFELTPSLGDLIGSYSHGMKQKLLLVAAFMHSPKLFVFDEPFVGLDPKASFQMKALMREACDRGSAVFFSTHVLDVAEKLCDRVAIIRAGRLIACGRTEDIRGDESLESVFLELSDEKERTK